MVTAATHLVRADRRAAMMMCGGSVDCCRMSRAC